MATYKTKPTTIQAIQLTWGNWSEVCDLVPFKSFVSGCYVNATTKQECEETTEMIGLKVKTADGNIVLIKQGDYVCIDSKGFAYPCDKEIFEAKYERMPENSETYKRGKP